MLVCIFHAKRDELESVRWELTRCRLFVGLWPIDFAWGWGSTEILHCLKSAEVGQKMRNIIFTSKRSYLPNELYFKTHVDVKEATLTAFIRNYGFLLTKQQENAPQNTKPVELIPREAMTILFAILLQKINARYTTISYHLEKFLFHINVVYRRLAHKVNICSGLPWKWKLYQWTPIYTSGLSQSAQPHWFL